jgi:hypothetical protein
MKSGIKTLTRLLCLPIILILLASCEKSILLDLEQTEPRIVIEGQVTDLSTYNYVKISRTTGFYSSGASPRITNATVSVYDDEGNNHVFLHYAGNNPDSAGYYFPEEPFAGVVNRTYTLTVVVNGELYEAQDTMFRLVSIDKLESRINPDEQRDPEKPGQYYEVLMYVQEPQDTRDYYLFKTYRNGQLEYLNDTDVYFADDELIGESIEGIPMPVFFAKGDMARVEVYSLSRDAFVFYRDLQKLLNNDGGLFGTPPANPRSNISNGALGLFQTSAVQVGEISVE